MRKSAAEMFQTFLLGFLLWHSLLAGVALTWTAAWVGLTTAFQYVTRCHRPTVSTAKMRVKAVREAVTQYMIETPSCPRSIDELLALRFIDKDKLKDPWGSPLVMRCPGNNDAEGADVSSPGPDRQDGTADDIRSWEL